MLLVGPTMPDRLRVVIQTRRDTLVLQVWGWAWGQQLHPLKSVTKPKGNAAEWTFWQRHDAIHRRWRQRTRNQLKLNIGSWNVCSLYRAVALKTFVVLTGWRKTQGSRNCLTAAQGRSRWRHFLDQAKNHVGL
jgi:hypothetical protein